MILLCELLYIGISVYFVSFVKMKVKTSIKKRCKYCKIIIRRNKLGVKRLYIYCSRDRRHNQRQG